MTRYVHISFFRASIISIMNILYVALHRTGLRSRPITGKTPGAPVIEVVITTHLRLISALNYVRQELSLCCASLSIVRN